MYLAHSWSPSAHECCKAAFTGHLCSMCSHSPQAVPQHQHLLPRVGAASNQEELGFTQTCSITTRSRVKLLEMLYPATLRRGTRDSPG